MRIPLLGRLRRLWNPAPARCTCGYLDWTTATFGRLTHKHNCAARRDPWCQSHPIRCP